MSLPHHHEPSDESELMKVFRQQQEGIARRTWPSGRIDGSDDGQVVFAISSDADKQLIKLDFGKPVVWTAMSPRDAVNLAQMLIKHARSISKDPIRVELH